MRPRVTVVIPTYNRGRLITRAIDSVLTQTYPNVDVVVIDDGSTDDTPAKLRAYEGDSRVRLVRVDHNLGVTGAKNAGLEALPSDADYLGILDSDDALEPSAIDALVRVFEQSDDRYSQVFGWCVDRDSGQLTGLMTHHEGPVTYDDALSGAFSGEFWQLADRRLLGDMRFDERAAGAESAVWWPLLRKREAWLIGDVVRCYDSSGADRVSVVTYTRESAIGRMWACHAGLAAVAEDMRDRYPRRYGDWLVELAKWSAFAGERRRALSAAREGIRYARSPRSMVMAGLVVLPPGLLRRLIGLRSKIRGEARLPGAKPAS